MPNQSSNTRSVETPSQALPTTATPAQSHLRETSTQIPAGISKIPSAREAAVNKIVSAADEKATTTIESTIAALLPYEEMGAESTNINPET